MSTYDAAFYANQRLGATQSASQVVPLLIDLVQPTSVIDVGCGVGAWLAEFQARGVNEILGVDGKHVDRSQLLISPTHFMPADLNLFNEDRNVRRVTLTYDLAISLEVAEHLQPRQASSFVQQLVNLSKVVAFSAAIPGQGGTGHVNEQWQSYWAKLFEQHGYVTLDVRPQIWENPEVEPWYRQNLLLYVQNDFLQTRPQLLALHGKGFPLDIVHPDIFTLHRTPIRNALRQLPHTLKHSGTSAIGAVVHRATTWSVGG